MLLRDDPAVYTNHHHDESFQAALRRRETPRPGVTVSYGVEGLHESIVSNNLGIHARSRGAAYGAVDFRALKRFSLSLSAREEVYRRVSGEFSPTIAGGVWISPVLKFRASASSAFRVPTYTDLYYEDPANLGNPHLLPEHAWTYDGGFDWTPSSRLRGSLTVFERRERNGIDYYRTSPDAPWQALNIDSLNFSGVESALHFVATRTQTIDFRYTWMLGTQDTVPIGYTKYSFNYPTDSGVVAWQGDFHGLLCRSRLGVLKRRDRDPYALWDIYAGFSRGQLHPFLQFSNPAAPSSRAWSGSWRNTDLRGYAVNAFKEIIVQSGRQVTCQCAGAEWNVFRPEQRTSSDAPALSKMHQAYQPPNSLTIPKAPFRTFEFSERVAANGSSGLFKPLSDLHGAVAHCTYRCLCR